MGCSSSQFEVISQDVYVLLGQLLKTDIAYALSYIETLLEKNLSPVDTAALNTMVSSVSQLA